MSSCDVMASQFDHDDVPQVMSSEEQITGCCEYDEDILMLGHGCGFDSP